MKKIRGKSKFWFLTSFILVLGGLFLLSFKKDIFSQSNAGELFTYSFAQNTVDVTVGMKTQYRNGVYDGVSNKTFIVYPSGREGEYSAANPYIVYYNHKNHTWSQEVEIDRSFAYQHDNHNYPQILMDSNGYLHVFSFGHGTPVAHAVSRNPRDISGWNISTIQNEAANRTTYPAAFKAKNGDMYVFFRETESSGTRPGDWHEPEHVLKSVDNGSTWNVQRIIDPLKSADGYNTVYTKSVYYMADPEGIHVTFGLHKNHNEYFNKHYYVFYSFQDNRLYSVSGRDFGSTIDRNEAEGCLECLILDYGRDLPFNTFNGYGVQFIAVSKDGQDSPIIFYTLLHSQGRGFLHIKRWNKNTNTWEDSTYEHLGEVYGASGTEYHSPNNIDIYIHKWEDGTLSLLLYRFDGRSLTKVQQVYGHAWKINFVSDYHPEIKFTFGKDWYTYWETPQPNGERLAAGERDFRLPNNCDSSSYFKNFVWSGKTFFSYPREAPCNEYSLGSSEPSNGELYSFLVPAKPNTSYKLNYEVKTRELIPSGAQYPGSVLIAEYNNSAQETDALTANRLHDGRRDNISPLTGTNDWTSREYNFTTIADTRYLRIRLLNAGWGESTGRVYFRNTNLTETSDLNGDGKIDAEDVKILLSHYGTNDSGADLNSDGIVNGIDFGEMIRLIQ